MSTSTEMSGSVSEKKLLRSLHAGAPPSEPEHIPCPRCDSTNTKFCYYNNYNFSQPRHFCKSCRRYWTHGGTLRDIPVGGGSRKNAKRSRSVSSSATAAANMNNHHSPTVFLPPHIDYRHQIMLSPFDHHHGGGGGGSFTSLLTTQGSGLFGLGGFGPGLIDDLGRSVWPFQGGQGGTTVNGGWQMENGGGDCFNLPELAISTPGTMLK